MENTYYSHLLELYPEWSQYLNWIKYELDNRVYYYGENFKNPFEKKNYKQNLRNNVSFLIRQFNNKKKSIEVSYENCILSEAYFNVNNIIEEELNIKVHRFPWSSCIGAFSKNKIRVIIKKLSNCQYNELLDENFVKEVKTLYEAIKTFVIDNHIKLVIFPNDLTPLNRIAIDACKEAGVKSSIYLHGLPARYDAVDDNRADYLCVWGEGIKKQYVAVGVNPEKILVTGHPLYSIIKFHKTKTIDLSKVLVLSSSVCGAPSISNKYIMADRGICVNYAWSVEKALKKLGVKNATYRLHPSENQEWYKKYINNDFYTIDTNSLDDTLKSHSIVIGPTTTVSMDAAIIGIPFFGFESPMEYAYPLVPPFDNSELSFPVAKSIDELVQNIKQGKCLRPEVFKKYIADNFDISKLINLVK